MISAIDSETLIRVKLGSNPKEFTVKLSELLDLNESVKVPFRESWWQIKLTECEDQDPIKIDTDNGESVIFGENHTQPKIENDKRVSCLVKSLKVGDTLPYSPWSKIIRITPLKEEHKFYSVEVFNQPKLFELANKLITY